MLGGRGAGGHDPMHCGDRGEELTVNHPEYPSAHAFWSTPLIHTIANFFGTNRLTWTIVTSKDAVPQVIESQRTYDDLNAIVREITDARV